MEIYELAITDEESRNYHNFYSKLSTLKFVDWVKAYMNTVVYVVLICTVLSLFSENLFHPWLDFRLNLCAKRRTI